MKTNQASLALSCGTDEMRSTYRFTKGLGKIQNCYYQAVQDKIGITKFFFKFEYQVVLIKNEFRHLLKKKSLITEFSFDLNITISTKKWRLTITQFSSGLSDIICHIARKTCYGQHLNNQNVLNFHFLNTYVCYKRAKLIVTKVAYETRFIKITKLCLTIFIHKKKSVFYCEWNWTSTEE